MDLGDGSMEMMEAGSRVGILIVARNSLSLTKGAVRTALGQDYPAEVMVIDNDSEDGTSQWLKTKRGVTVISFQEQRSLAGCWNYGLRAFWKAGADCVLVLNNDCEIRPDAVRLLLAHGGEFVTCVSVDSRDRMGWPEGSSDSLKRLKSRRPHPDFSCFLIRKSVTEKGIWFNEDCWPAYCEDSFFHVEIHKAGIKAVCVDVPFLHHGASTLKSASTQEQERIRKGADKNRQRFREKYGCLPGSKGYERLFA